MSNFNFFRIFAHKTQRGLAGLISTQDKIEEIKYRYNKNAARYIKSAEDLLVNARELKAKFKELDDRTITCKRHYEDLIEASKSQTDPALKAQKLAQAKSKFIVYDGVKKARDAIEKAWQTTEKQCEQVKETLRNIETNKDLIEAKLESLKVQIDTLKACARNEIGDFGFECNEMIAEIEKQVQTTQFRIEAKEEIAETIRPGSESRIAPTEIDSTFDEVVKAYMEAHP